ncbi:hypothetical protein D5R95_00200 [Methanosalsum natronophilum]|uniref:DNA repair protein n=1 Tax=Methanosalsum natronophilum TaxID=768733 RepID=A0A424Z4Q3_9EURY|nr:MAG: hypothetical protein D5R95_00200 [Methanosalsum natronophilum]
MKELEIFTLTLASDKPIEGTAAQLRGYFATKFTEYTLLHHHDAGVLMYHYPLVQYKVIKGIPTVIGINEGSDLLKEIYHVTPSIHLGGQDFRIIETGVDLRRVPFGLSTTFFSYEFITPWLALNQKNYIAYYGMKNNEERQALLRRILIGNIISMSKSIGYEVNDRIKCDLTVSPQKKSLKDVNLMAFSGTFHINFHIPDTLGIGKSVSRGFGTVRQLKNIQKDG